MLESFETLVCAAVARSCLGWTVESTSGQVSILPADSALAVLLIGLPGSGKSTLAQQLKQDLPECQWISTDAIRAQLFGDEAVQGEWLQVQDELERQLQQATRQMGAADTVMAIYDATNAIPSHRRTAISLTRAAGFSRIAGLWLNVTLDRCLLWNRRRDRKVPHSAILHMHYQLCNAPPNLSDGFDCLIQIRPVSGSIADRCHQPGSSRIKSG